MLTVDLKLLQEFMHLSKDLSFTKTAERCYVSQSVLSRHIQALEAELGCELLIRDKRGVRLTAYGESFAESCRAIIAEYDKALANLDNIVGGFTEILRISYVSPLPAGFIDAAYDLQLERYPDVKLDLMATWEERAIILLNQGKVSLSIFMAFDEPDPAQYDSIVLFTDNYVLLVPEGHPLAASKELTLKDFANEVLLIPSVRDFPIQHARIAKVMERAPKVKVRSSLNSKHDAVALAKAQRGIPLIRSHVLDGMELHSLAPVSVAEDDLRFNIRAVWRRDNADSSLQGFVQILEELRDSGCFVEDAAWAVQRTVEEE